MSLDAALTIALDVAYIAVFAASLVDYLRRRDPVRRAVAAVFGSLAIVFIVQIVRNVVPALGPALGFVGIAGLLAQPVLILWLIGYFRPVPKGLIATAAALGIASTAGILTIGATNLLVIVGVVAYFVGFEALAAILLAREAGFRAGSARTRLFIAAAATALFGTAIFVAGAGAAAGSGAGSSGAAAATATGRVLALLAAAGYLIAFVPPRWLRAIGHQATAFEFMRQLARVAPGTPPFTIWDLLARTALRITGATGAAVAVGPHGARSIIATAGDWTEEAGEDAAAPPSLVVPLGRGEPTGTLTLRLRGQPLFVEDDVELLTLLAGRAAISAEREAMIAELRRASAAKSDFLAAMSHELRTPLNSIIGFSELLLRPADARYDPSTVVEFAEHIHGSGLHLLELINDVLDLAKVEAGRLDLRLTRIDLRAVVRQTLDTMKPLADRRSISLRGPEPGRLEIEADPGRLRQVIFNLVSNAIKFTPEGGRVSVDVEGGDGEARLVVADTGPGIASADQERIFEAFQQLGPGDSARQQGTGLGLALTRQLVEAHGGRIELESEVGRGSRFSAVFPLASDATIKAAPAAGPSALDDGHVVLVIEDDHRAAELVRVYLAEAGYPVVIAPDGRTGLDLAKRLRPAAIVLDILLPDMDGWEVLQRLKGADGVRDIPVIVVSVVEDADLGFALGAVDYFVKPVARHSLLSALGRLTFTTKVRERTVTVLVIDADPDAGERYRTELPEGFEVTVAPTGARGLELATKSPPDLILLELLLPDLDGFEVVSRLKADERTRSVPIWVATRGDLGAEDKARLNGHVLGVTERGDSGMAGLHEWLGRVAVAGRRQ